MKLLAGRFANSDTSAGIIEQFANPQNVRIRWSLPGGVQRIEVTVPVRDTLDIYDRMQNHPGQRLAVYSSTGSRPISGNIYEVKPINSRQVTYIAKGPWARHFNLYDTSAYAEDDTNNEVVETVLGDHVPIVAANYTNISATGTALNGWQPAPETGSLPGDIILEMAEMSNSSDETIDYWLRDEQFDGLALQQYIPFFQPRDSTIPDWLVSVNDMKSLSLSRTITDLRNDVTIYYGIVGGDATTGGSSVTATLTDSGASFTTAGIQPGDSIYNETDGSRGRITAVVSNTVIQHTTLSGGTNNYWTVGDVYTIRLQDLQPVTSTASPLNPFAVEYRETVAQFDETQADQYAAATRGRLDSPTQFASFTLTSSTVRAAAGGRLPLFDIIANGGGYIQIVDLYPTLATLDTAQNGLDSFFITAMDYDEPSNALRVALDNPDSRFDARLVKAGIIGAEGVYT